MFPSFSNFLFSLFSLSLLSLFLSFLYLCFCFVSLSLSLSSDSVSASVSLSRFFFLFLSSSFYIFLSICPTILPTCLSFLLSLLSSSSSSSHFFIVLFFSLVLLYCHSICLFSLGLFSTLKRGVTFFKEIQIAAGYRNVTCVMYKVIITYTFLFEQNV